MELNNNTPSSVLFVKMAAYFNMPIGLETFERALKDGPEYFPEEIEYRRKWDAIPQEVKDAYFAESSLYKLHNYDGSEPEIIRNWPGIISATDDEFKAWNEYHDSEAYKNKVKAQEQKDIECYNKHFAKYGLTK